MTDSIQLAPPNSLFFLSDFEDDGIGPEFIPDRLILSTPSCISIGCLAFVDGKTTLTLAPSTELDLKLPPAFTGFLKTPNRGVRVSTVEHPSLLRLTTGTVSSKVRIWVNRPIEPDRIIIGIGAAS